MKRLSRPLAAPLCTALSATLLATPPVGAQASISDIAFSQVDWYDAGETLRFPNSVWGGFTVTMHPDPLDFYYINVVGDAGRGPAWLIQNWPIFPQGLLGDPRQAVDFNTRDLGLDSGTDLPSLDALITVDLHPRTMAPGGPFTPFGVENAAWTQECGTCGPAGCPMDEPGDPVGHKAEGPVTEVAGKDRKVPPVQQDQGGGTCMAAAFARSLGWLNEEFGIGVKRTPQQIHDQLRDFGAKPPASRTEIIAAKVGWTDSIFGKGTIVTKVKDEQDVVGPIKGVTEAPAGTDLEKWLFDEYKAQEDIELAYGGPNAHMVTVVGIYKQAQGKTFVKYRTDNEPTRTKGDEAVREGKLYQHTTLKNYWFGVDTTTAPPFKGQVNYAVSESSTVSPEPASLLLLATGLAGLAARRRRRQASVSRER